MIHRNLKQKLCLYAHSLFSSDLLLNVLPLPILLLFIKYILEQTIAKSVQFSKIAFNIKRIFFQVYRIVEDLYEKTCTNVPVTVNEKQFQDTYLATIEEAIKTLRLKRSEPRQAWASFKLVIPHFFFMAFDK